MFTQPRTAYFGAGAVHASQVFTVRADGRVSVRLRQDGLARWNPIVHPCLPSLRRAITGCQRRLRLQPGQGYLLDNHRWLHARTQLAGKRLCLRALGEPRTPLREGFAANSIGVKLPRTTEGV